MKIVIPIISYISATIFGIYTQSLAYYFHDHFKTIEPFTFLIIFSLLSFLLFCFTFVFYWIVTRKAYRLPHDIIGFLALFFTLPIMGWTFIVCMFWWG